VPDYVAGLGGGAAGLRVGVAGGFYAAGLDSTVTRALAEAVAVLGGLGARVEPLAVPDPAPLVTACSNVMVRAESAAIHWRILKERPGELQPAVRDRLAPGLAVSAQEYLQGQRLRAKLTREFIDLVFSRVDVLVTPTIPEPAPALAQVKAGPTADVIARMGRFSRLTRPFNALGLPALSLPCGAAADGRPLAMQLVGRPFDEATLLRLGHAYERATAWHRRRPVLP
jgi:aspartyl-tRNA(Asn)/glutamyl-tRNA(Gln) amidotransferase subunit A